MEHKRRNSEECSRCSFPYNDRLWSSTKDKIAQQNPHKSSPYDLCYFPSLLKVLCLYEEQTKIKLNLFLHRSSQICDIKNIVFTRKARKSRVIDDKPAVTNFNEAKCKYDLRARIEGRILLKIYLNVPST